LVFEKATALINEQEYIDSTFEDNIRSLVKILKDNDFLSQTKDTEHYVKNVLAQPKNVKEIVLDTQEQSLPAMKLHAKQESDSESFSVTVIDLENPDKQKEFANSMLETIFDDVVDYIKTTAMQGLSPDNAVEEMPQAEGGEAQPGAEQSALPTEETEEQPQG
jgi:restriction endonuclease Mrr